MALCYGTVICFVCKFYIYLQTKPQTLLQKDLHTTKPIENPERLLGSKIPITELIIEVKDKITGEIVYRTSTIIVGHNIPSTRIEAIKKNMRDEYLEYKRKELSCPKEHLTNMDTFPDQSMKM